MLQLNANAERQPVQFTHAATARSVNETLVTYGFLGASPEKPTLAFSFSLFEIYRQIHRVCPRFSIHALAKSLCHLHQVNSPVQFRVTYLSFLPDFTQSLTR
jgi:hypothetical protein